ncbi:MAG: methylated-DNA--[protein]-cysteine S-methyltransferase [Dehalococcoidales bacterium]
MLRQTHGAVLETPNGKFGSLQKMDKEIRYTILSTRWGYFGLMGAPEGLRYTSLPVATRGEAGGILLAHRPSARYDSRLFVGLQEQIKAYFGGTYVEFSPVPVDLAGFSAFAGKVLLACRKIPWGQTVSYSQLAQLAHSPKAVRAAGSVMAQNPMPLVIPCHRVIRSDGSVGNFSAPGGRNLKQRLLDLEAGNHLGEQERLHGV